MPAAGQTTVDFNDVFFDEMLNSAGVRALTRGAAEKALNIAKANAPVDTGAYRDGLQVEAVQHAHRTTYRVVGTDAKTMLIESQTGNLVKALKKAKS
ncbi:HK97 gp10 family phage protein [Bifidobacterium longum]|uniref:HK97 gp10 family phage protein n=1 Tax=Bifidobacterium longum TaxID=216816 RepID=UPI00226A7D23|nr:HK97 gp10 family phage protein [Bifidobacterium longum]